MASAPPPVASTKETTNYARLCRLLVDVGSQALRDTFDRIHPPAGLHLVLGRHPEHGTLQSLKKKKILNPTQWGKLFPTIPSSVSSASFDITLLMVLLRNMCGLSPPLTGWDNLPSATDPSIEANITRVKYYRNTVYGHASQASVDDVTFNACWQDISNALVGLGGASYGAAINKLKNESMDPGMEEHYRELLKQWKKDEDSIKDKLKEIEDKIKDDLQQMKSEIGNVNEKLDTLMKQSEETKGEDQTRDDLKQMKTEIRNISEKLNSQMTSSEEGNSRENFEQMKDGIVNIKEKIDTLMNRLPPVKKKPRMEDVFDATETIDEIRRLYKRREGWLAPFPWCEYTLFHLDDIYTRLKVVSRKKARGIATTKIVHMSGIFKPHEECPNPRTVLIEGEPGMGKTTYCKKLAYDWAIGKLEAEDSFPRFEAVLLLKCHDMKSDLWEAIDDQLLPRDVEEDERERLFDYIRNNQSNILLVLDGLDEVPASKLPIFSELIQGRVLPKCYVVATARHEAGTEVRIHCDTLLQIEGFTEEDARKFIVKYFKGLEGLDEKLLFKLRNDKNVKEISANPLNTALLCLICEEFKGIFPESRTQLYLEIVRCILTRYRRKKGLSKTNEDLIQVYDAELQHLGWIALNGLREDNLDFEESELEKYVSSLPGFGFLSVQPGGSKLRPCRRYRFLHKSFQEWFAAFYLYCQLIEKKISPDSLAADRRYAHEMKEVLSFTCGMLAAQCKENAVDLIRSVTTQVNQKEDEEEDDEDEEDVKEEDDDENEDNKEEDDDEEDEEHDEEEDDDVDDDKDDDEEDEEDEEHDKEEDDDEVKKEDAVGWLTVVLMSINECIESNKSFHTELACAFGSFLKLRSLSLRSKRISGADVVLANALKSNTSLTKLYVSDTDIGDAGAVGLAGALKSNTTLRVLNLSSNYIGDDGAVGLADALKSNTTLRVLYLSSNNIGDAGAVGLAGALKSNTTLTVLLLSSNYIGDAGAVSLADALKSNTTLTVLNVNDNNIGVAWAVGLADALKSSTALTRLYVKGNNIGVAGALSLADALKSNTTLRVLNLSSNNIDDAGAVGLADVLKSNKTLSVLDLFSNNIGNAGAVRLADALKSNTTLTKLNVDDNNIGDAGAVGLADALKSNTTLTRLIVKGNIIGDAGAVGLADALKSNTTLTELNVKGNNIGDAGAVGLADALKSNTTLTELNVKGNNIGDAGAVGLADALKSNTTLAELNVKGNNIGDAGAAGLADALKSNTTLTELKLSNNKIGDAGRACLSDARVLN